MPIYDYECTACGSIEEIRHGFGQHHDAGCAKCGGAMKRRLSATGIVFKGSGFYVTDSRKKESGSGSGESKPAESKSETKSESKAAPASDAA